MKMETETSDKWKRSASPVDNNAPKNHASDRRRANDENLLRRRRPDSKEENSGKVYFLYGDMKENDRDKEEYVETLKRELTKIDPTCVQSRRLVEAEISRVQDVKAYPQDHIQLHRDRLIKLCAKICVPVHEYPQVSFLGRIFGPGGENLKNLCRSTRSKIGLFGAGCTKSPEKEREMLKRNEPQHEHLHEPLHLYVETIGFPAEAYARLAHVMNEARKFMDPYYPGIPNMKPEEIKRLIFEQRRVSGLYKTTTNDLNPNTVSEPAGNDNKPYHQNNSSPAAVNGAAKAPMPPKLSHSDFSNGNNNVTSNVMPPPTHVAAATAMPPGGAPSMHAVRNVAAAISHNNTATTNSVRLPPAAESGLNYGAGNVNKMPDQPVLQQPTFNQLPNIQQNFTPQVTAMQAGYGMVQAPAMASNNLAFQQMPAFNPMMQQTVGGGVTSFGGQDMGMSANPYLNQQRFPLNTNHGNLPMQSMQPAAGMRPGFNQF